MTSFNYPRLYPLETTLEKGFKRKLAREIDDAYIDSLITKSLSEARHATVFCNYPASSEPFGSHVAPNLEATNAPQSPPSQSLYVEDPLCLFEDTDTRVDTLERRLERLEIAGATSGALHPDEMLGFTDADRHGIEKLEDFRTNRLQCQIYGILRAKLDNGELHPFDFNPLAQSVIVLDRRQPSSRKSMLIIT